jgi:hypothetical protein
MLCVPAVVLLALPSQAQDSVEAMAQSRMKANAIAADMRREISSAAAAAQIPGHVNDDETFQMICRGGPGLRIRMSEPWVTQGEGRYCRLRDALSGPGLLIADAQPGVPVRDVNGDACVADACRVAGELQCDH